MTLRWEQVRKAYTSREYPGAQWLSLDLQGEYLEDVPETGIAMRAEIIARIGEKPHPPLPSDSFNGSVTAHGTHYGMGRHAHLLPKDS
jgi:hypothetical protein